MSNGGKNFKDLTGKKFGRLTVIKRADDYISPKGKHLVRWLCNCDCGNNIKNKHTSSCGCLSKEVKSKISKKYNDYDLTDEYGVGYTAKGEEFYFDLEDYDKIKNYCWYISNDGYVYSRDCKTNKNIAMHRLIMNFPDTTYDIDHIHGNKSRSNNRKSNLRIATKSQNRINTGLRKDNTSGVTGVYFDKRYNIWYSRIKVNDEYIHLGCFDNFEDAVAARKEAEEKYFGEWSYDNSQLTMVV